MSLTVNARKTARLERKLHRGDRCTSYNFLVEEIRAVHNYYMRQAPGYNDVTLARDVFMKKIYSHMLRRRNAHWILTKAGLPSLAPPRQNPQAWAESEIIAFYRRNIALPSVTSAQKKGYTLAFDRLMFRLEEGR